MTRVTPPELPTHPDLATVCGVAPFYEQWLPAVIEWIVARYEADPGYRFLDTKYDVQGRRDFDADDPFRGKSAVFGWIQGRGLESLVVHAEWLTQAQAAASCRVLVGRINRVVDSLSQTLSEVRERNAGRMFFLMDRDGSPRFDGGAPAVRDHYSFADIFCAKGLYAAAHHRADEPGLRQARDYLVAIAESLGEFRFRSLQFKPGLPASNDDPRLVRQEGPFMIFLGALALMAEREGGGWCTRAGLRIIDRILSCHTASADMPPLARRGDMWETVDEHDRPLLHDGRLQSDPGHSIEFVGLASRFLRAIERREGLEARDAERIRAARARLPDLLFANFENGFRSDVEGITKTVDLVSRDPVDPTLPWWSLPETMRAAAQVLVDHSGDDGSASVGERCRALFALCHNALVRRYLVPGNPALWVQTRSADGRTVDVVPACPDVDPGYHTNLSIIEALRLFDEVRLS